MRVTCPSALASFAPNAMTAMVKPTLRWGGVRNRSNTDDSDSPLRRAFRISAIFDQIDMGPDYAKRAGASQGFLHQHKVVVLAEFPAHLRHCANMDIAKRGMKTAPTRHWTR